VDVQLHAAEAPVNTGVIDRFTEVFTRYIDSGFGLLGGEVAFLASTLVVIDVTLAGIFWAWGVDEDVLARLVKKTLYVGFFAFLIGNFNNLAKIVFNSFAGLGLKAAGAGLTANQLLQPGKVAQVGIDAGKPILQAASQLMGFVSFFENFIQIFILLLAWFIVLIAFFVLAIQLFVTLIEFKLTTLAGFVLVPFGLFNKTAYLAEKVLGNVVASGVKVLVLAVIVGIGTTLFGEFTQGFGGTQPALEDALSLVLAALSLLALGIFGPGIAAGLTSGAPQLGAGAAVSAGIAAGGLAIAGTSAAGVIGNTIAGTARGTSSLAGGAAAAYRTGAAASGEGGLKAGAAGTASVAQAGITAASDRIATLFSGQSGAASGSASSTQQRQQTIKQNISGLCARAIVAAVDRALISRTISHESVQTPDHPLWPHARTRDALPEGRPSLGRTDRFGPSPGPQLAAHGIWLPWPILRIDRRPHLHGVTRDSDAVGRPGRQARRAASCSTRHRRLSPDRSANCLASRAIHRGHPFDCG
jgi:type IV secretion system protein TrbL